MSTLCNSENTAKLLKLDANGKNWILYREEVHSHIISKPKLRRHLDGRVKKPTKPSIQFKDPADTSSEIIKPTTAELDKYEEEMDEWCQHEQSIKSILYQTLHETLKLCIMSLSAHEAWSHLCATFNNLGSLMQADILSQMHSAHCAEQEDPWPILDELEHLCAKYATAGGQLDDNAWQVIVLAVLPKLHRDMLAGILAMQTVTSKYRMPGMLNVTLTGDDVISLIHTRARNDQTINARSQHSAALSAQTRG
jgi:hypothetical protein